jgi:hypothetical protein
VGVKQGDNIGPILFIYLVQAVPTSLHSKWNFIATDFGRRDLKKDAGIKCNHAFGKRVLIKTQNCGMIDDASYIMFIPFFTVYYVVAQS